MRFVFNKLNVILLLVAILFTAAAYIIMGRGDDTLSPIMLIFAYVVLFPAAIIAGVKKSDEQEKGRK